MNRAFLAQAAGLCLYLILLPDGARADSVSDLKGEMALIESQIKALQANTKNSSPARQDALAKVTAEVAHLKKQLARIAAQPDSPPLGAPQGRASAVPLALNPAPPAEAPSASANTVAAVEPAPIKPLVGGILLYGDHGGAFFIAGTLDAGVRIDSGAGHTITSVQSGLMRASRLTLEGYQDIGFGLRAVGVIEGGLNLATGTGASNPTAAGSAFDFGREAFVGLGNDTYGYIDFGRQYSPIWAVSAGPDSDPFVGNYLGGIIALDPTLAVNSRVSNAITYNYRYSWEGMLDPSPSVGFGFAAMYAPGGGNGTAADPGHAGQQFGASASYGTARWWVGAGYHQIDGWNASVAPFTNTYLPATTNKTALVEATLAASYLTPWGRVFVQLNSQKDGRKLAQNGGVDQEDWFVGFVAPTFPQQNLRFSYGQFYNHTSTRAEYSVVQASYEYDLVRVPGTALYLEGLLIANNKNSAQGALGATNVIGSAVGPTTFLPDQLTANGSTPLYGATATSITTGIRFIF